MACSKVYLALAIILFSTYVIRGKNAFDIFLMISDFEKCKVSWDKGCSVTSAKRFKWSDGKIACILVAKKTIGLHRSLKSNLMLLLFEVKDTFGFFFPD